MSGLHFQQPTNTAGTKQSFICTVRTNRLTTQLPACAGGNFQQGVKKMKVKSIRGLQRYLKQNSSFSGRTINSVIFALGYHPQNEKEGEFIELSGIFKDCSERGADIGFSGFIYYSETIPFFKKHRMDIVQHMEQTAAELGINIISMVQGFGVFKHSSKPTAGEVGKVLWGIVHHPEQIGRAHV